MKMNWTERLKTFLFVKNILISKFYQCCIDVKLVLRHFACACIMLHYTGRKPGTGCAHTKIARVARVVFVLYVVGRA